MSTWRYQNAPGGVNAVHERRGQRSALSSLPAGERGAEERESMGAAADGLPGCDPAERRTPPPLSLPALDYCQPASRLLLLTPAANQRPP